MALAVMACESPQPPAACETLPQVTVNAKETATVTACFNDPNGDMLSYSATSSNPGVVTASSSGATVTVTAVSPGSASIVVTAADPGGLQGQQSFLVLVPNRAPQPRGTMPSMTVSAGQSGAVDASSYFSEPDGEALVYSAASSDNQKATVSAAGSMVTVTAVAKGTVAVTVLARDPGGLTGEQTFQVTVPNRAPESVGTIEDIEVEVDSSAVVDVAKHFHDPDGDVLTYVATSSRTTGVGVSVSGSVVTVRGVAKGSATVTVTAEDAEGLAARQTFRVTVPNRAPKAVGTIGDIEVEVDSSAVVDVAKHFHDPDGDVLTYVATSSRTTGVGVSVSGSVVTVRGVAKGSATVTVTAEDAEGLTARQTFQVTVPNRAPKAVGTIGDIEVGAEATAEVDVARYFTDPDGDRLTYTAESSMTQRVGVSVSGSVVTVRGVAKGSATVTVTAEDTDGLTARQTFQVTVPNRAPKAVGTIEDQKMDVGDHVEIDIEDYFSDPDGDDLAYTAESSDTNVATVSVSGPTVTLRASAAGSAVITVIARDSDGLTATQRSGVTVAQTNRPPRPVGTIPDQMMTEGDTVSLDMEDYFSDPDGDDLTYSVESSRPSVATASMSGSTATVVAAVAGTATMTVTATDPGNLSATQTFRVTVSVRETFDLDIWFTPSVSSTVRSEVRDARDEWEAVLEDTELDDITVNRTLSCHGIPGFVGTVDDHLIFVDVDSIDGEGGVLAWAGYCYIRRADDSPLLSATRIDEADVKEMMDQDALVPVMFHELAHALGFAGGHWDRLDLLEKGSDAHFTGELAIEAFDEAGGEDYDGEKVPVQLRVYSHWRESVFGDEIMTPSIDLRNDEVPISAITLQAMADAGYEVDVSGADDYELPGSDDIQARRRTGRVFDLSNDVVWGPVTVLDSDGRVVRVIPAPPGAFRWPVRPRHVPVEPRRPPGSGPRSK